jgi:alpha-ketoglutarate-dependent taurine dioxygenase
VDTWPLRATRRRVGISGESLVSIGPLFDTDGFPLVIAPRVAEFDLAAWCASHVDLLGDLLVQHGAVLFRGGGAADAEAFRVVAGSAGEDLLTYQERAAPRHEVGTRVYTSTEFAHDQTIPLHHEMSYSRHWPRRIWFYCQQPAQHGGCTPIADDRRVLPRLPGAIREPFERLGVLYVRNYGEGADLSWQDAFQTTERAAVEAYAAQAGMTCEWRDGDRLRTRTIGPATVRHPISGALVWFNHAHLFHVSNLQPAVREELQRQFADDELPRNAFYGDGSPIPADALDLIRQTYDDCAVRFTWTRGDVLLLDNILTSHGRDPFDGPRSILVAMTGAGSHQPALR